MSIERQGLLEEFDPRVGLDTLSASDLAKQRGGVVNTPERLTEYLGAFAALEGQKAVFSARACYPLLVGVQTNLYKCFLERSWSLGSVGGVVALIHQDGLFDDPKGAALRRAAYARLRWVFRFKNELQLFADVHNLTPYVLTVSSAPASGAAQFQYLSNLFHPSTIDATIEHDGMGAVPGIKTDGNDFEVAVTHVGSLLSKQQNWRSSQHSSTVPEHPQTKPVFRWYTVILN